MRAKLESVANFHNGAAFKPEDWSENGQKIIRIQNLTDPSKKYNRTTRKVPEKLVVKKGDLLVSWSATLGVFEWSDNEDAVLNQHIFRVEPKPGVHVPYLKQALIFSINDMDKHLHGATMKHINRGEFLNTEVFFPPLAEQRRIAEILDRAEALRAKRREAIALLDELGQALFLEMFGEQISSPQTKFHSLNDIIKPGTIITYGIVQAGDEFPGGIPYIRTGDIQNGKILTSQLRKTSPEIASKYNRSRVSTGDLVMSIRATVGSIASVEPDCDGANLTQGTAKISPGSGINPNYLIEHIRSHKTQEWLSLNSKGAVFREITLARLRSLPIFVPRIEEQDQYANRILFIRKSRESQARQLNQLDELFASLQHRAFRGEL